MSETKPNKTKQGMVLQNPIKPRDITTSHSYLCLNCLVWSVYQQNDFISPEKGGANVFVVSMKWRRASLVNLRGCTLSQVIQRKCLVQEPGSGVGFQTSFSLSLSLSLPKKQVSLIPCIRICIYICKPLLIRKQRHLFQQKSNLERDKQLYRIRQFLLKLNWFKPSLLEIKR